MALGLRFGREFAHRIQLQAPPPSDKLRLDEIVIAIAGKENWLGGPSTKTASFLMSSSSAEATKDLYFDARGVDPWGFISGRDHPSRIFGADLVGVIVVITRGRL